MLRLVFHLFSISILLISMMAGCGDIQLPEPPEVPELPAIPTGLPDLDDILPELELPDLSQVPNLPELADLPIEQAPPGGILFIGPTERRLNIGEGIPGTDIVLTASAADGAEFQIAGLRSVRKAGDSLDYDGGWPGLAGVEYHLRARLYFVGETNVRLAGVHQLIITNIQPSLDNSVAINGQTLKFPYTVSANAGEALPGLSYRYIGSGDQGVQLGGLPEGEFPYRQLGDSIVWQGRLRDNIVASYDLRLLFYNSEQARVGGIVTVAMPGP
jgi:hypothetical protein